MIKSVTIKDWRGRVILKVICRKNGTYEMTRLDDYEEIICEVRDEKNQKVLFDEGG